MSVDIKVFVIFTDISRPFHDNILREYKQGTTVVDESSTRNAKIVAVVPANTV